MTKRGSDVRTTLSGSRRLIIKVGSKSLSGDSRTNDIWARLAEDIAAVCEANPKRRVVVVTSGAIALGVAKLGMNTRPKDMARLQAAAAAGQSVLMQRYEEAFSRENLTVAQVLLTHADLASRVRSNNARNALAALFELNAIPIINENDAVAVDEIKFGDNDKLAAMVVPLCEADLLILLSDVSGLLDDHGERVPFVEDIENEAVPFARKSTSGVGTGGMISKIESAERATYAGAHVVIAQASEPQIIRRIVDGEDVGTLFARHPNRLSARKHWILYTLRPKGHVVLDDGAAHAVVQTSSSILAVGVVGVRGAFDEGDAVSLVDLRGTEIARGIVKVDASEAARLAKRNKDDGGSTVLVHRDDLVNLPAKASVTHPG